MYFEISVLILHFIEGRTYLFLYPADLQLKKEYHESEHSCWCLCNRLLGIGIYLLSHQISLLFQVL